MRNFIFLTVILLASNVNAQSPPSWVFMPETTREEREEREEARLRWIKQRKILRAMRAAELRRQRIFIRKYWSFYRYYRIYR